MDPGKTAEFLDTSRVSKEGEEARNIAVCTKSIDFRKQGLEIRFGEFPRQIRTITFSGDFRDEKDRTTRRQLISQRDSERLFDERWISRKGERIIIVLLLLCARRF